jgi:hypothetical protein
MGCIVLVGLAAATAQALPPPSPPASAPVPSPDSVATIVVEGRAPVVGDLQKGITTFQPTFFTTVRPASAMDMVQWLPGFYFQDTRDMRGLEGAGGNVLIDGKPPTSKTDTLQMVLRRIPTDQVERVDIIVGGAPGVDMHGWPVVANVVLKKSARTQRLLGVSNFLDTHGNASPELLFTSSHNEDGRLTEFGFDVGKNIAIYPTFGYGPWTRRDPAGAALLTADAEVLAGGPFATANGAIGRPVAGGSMKLNGLIRYYGTNVDETDALVAAPGAFGYTHDQTYLQGEVGLSYERPFGKRLTLNLQALERPTHVDVDNLLTRPPTPSELNKREDDNEAVLRASLRFKTSDRLTLESSAEGALNRSNSRSDEMLNGQPVVLPDALVDIRERRGELGETMSWKPGPKISVDAALKLESSTFTGEAAGHVENTYTYLKPRLLMTWSPDKQTQVRFRLEHEAGQISFSWFTAGSNFASGEILAGNVDIRPQRDWVQELTLERRFWTGGDLTLTYRHLELVDVADFVATRLAGGAVVSGYGNIGAGAEDDLSASFTMPFKHLGWDGAMLKGTVTWSNSSVTDPVTLRLRRLMGKAALVGELHFAQDLPQWRLNFGFDAFYQGPSVIYIPLGDQRTGVWGRINLFAEYRATAHLNLRAEVQNLPGTRVTVANDAYAGPKGAAPLLYTDVKHLAVGPLLFLRARRTFN